MSRINSEHWQRRVCSMRVENFSINSVLIPSPFLLAVSAFVLQYMQSIRERSKCKVSQKQDDTTTSERNRMRERARQIAVFFSWSRARALVYVHTYVHVSQIVTVKVKAKRHRWFYLTDLINSVVKIIVILCNPVIVFLFPWGRLIERVCTWFMINSMRARLLLLLLLRRRRRPLLVRSARPYFNECSMLMYGRARGWRQKRQRKENVTSTRIISTSINQVDSSFLSLSVRLLAMDPYCQFS